MTATELLTDLARRGVLIAPTESGKLRVQSPNQLTEGDRAALRELKPELLTLLAQPFERACILARWCEATGTDLAVYLRRDAWFLN